MKLLLIAILVFVAAPLTIAAPPQPTCTFSVTPKLIPHGVPTPVTFTWTTTGTNINGRIFHPVIGNASVSGSTTYVVPGQPMQFNLIAFSNTTLINSTGTYALCKASVSTFGAPQP